MRKFTVLTTFNKKGLNLYGQKFIDSFIENMPSEVELYIYSENCLPDITKKKNRVVNIIKTQDTLHDLSKFKNKHKNDPRANGLGIEVYNKRLQEDNSWILLRIFYKLRRLLMPQGKVKRFQWDAIRFSHKTYSVLHAAQNIDTDILIWMDADTIIHSKMPISFLNKIIPEDCFTCYLGRKNTYTECGFYSMNLKHPKANVFFKELERVYEEPESGIFTLEGSHDCYAYDFVRLWHEKEFNVKNKDIGKGLANKPGGHVLINSELGAYLDHLKGDRKTAGKSKNTDLVVKRKESYWSNI